MPMATSPPNPPTTTSHDDVLARLPGDALRALGDAGQPERANVIAGLAWAALRRERPVAAQRINVLMHRLARQQDVLETREEHNE